MRVPMDKAGRVVLPKAVRDGLRLRAGDELEVTSGGDGIHLRPVRAGGELRRERGVWVWYSGVPVTQAETDALLDAIRGERSQ